MYQGYIKDYEGATLMGNLFITSLFQFNIVPKNNHLSHFLYVSGCELNPKIVYTEFTAVVRKQKEILKKLIERKQNQIRKVHPGLTCFREGVRDIPIESIPGILEAGYSPQERGATRLTRTADEKQDVESLYNSCLLYTSPSPRDGLLSRMPSSA